MGIHNTEFDAIVVGAGPAGSVVAEALARASLRVALIEEHPAIGVPNHCSGLVSPRTLELAGVAEEAVGLARFSHARVWGPSGQALWVRSNGAQAIAIDRTRFDQTLAQRAVNAGAVLMLGTRVCHLERSAERMQVVAQTEKNRLDLHAPLVVGADGAGSQVARWMGMNRKCETMPAVKADLTFQGCQPESVEILVGNHVAPGWFGWIIPLPDGTARAGLGATHSPQCYLESFLHLIRGKFGDFVVREVRQAALPLGPARDFVADRVMLVGAAARQTKPTTGGGIYLGIRAAFLAATTAAKAIERGDCSCRRLAEYEQAWQRLEGRELLYGHWLRSVFRHLSDRDLNLLIDMLGKPQAQGLISRLGDIDYPSRLFLPLTATLRKRAVPPRGVEALVRASQTA
jgi:geranylgeranyl reductase family protein